MGNIKHKDRNRLEIKHINWQVIRRKERKKSVISAVRKKNASNEGGASARVGFYANLILQPVLRRLWRMTSTGQPEIDK